jgi:glutamyl-tRNA synthetase
MVNFLALLGWSPGGDREVMSLEEMVELFSAGGLQKKAAIFDPKKLEWMNGQHLSRTSAEVLEPLVSPALREAGLFSDELQGERRDWYLALLELLKVRARTVHDVVRQARPYLQEQIEYDPEAISRQWKDPEATRSLLEAARTRLAAVTEWNAVALEDSLRLLAEERGVAGGKIFQPLRVALTGMTVSPGIFEVLEMLGPRLTLKRVDDAVRMLSPT